MKIRMIVAALATAALMSGAALANLPANNNSNKPATSTNRPTTQKMVRTPKSKSDTSMSKSKSKVHKAKKHKGKKATTPPSAK